MGVVIFCGLLTTCIVLAGAIPIDMFYPFGLQNGDKALKKGFMERSERLRVEGGFRFLGSRFYNVWVTTDGYLALDHLPNRFASEIKPFPSKGDGAIIAPYLADADTSGVGDIYYRHITNSSDPTLRAISMDIADSNFLEFINANFTAKMAIIATWYQVGYFHGNFDKNNTFQVAVAVDDNGNTIAVFNYLDDGLNWYQADEDYYDYTEDDPEISPVQVGFNKGGEDEISYTVHYTMTPEVLKLDDYSNRNRPGQWTFNIGNEGVTVGEQKIIGTGKNQNATGDDDVRCGRCIRRCEKEKKCTRFLQRFRRNCIGLLEKGSECSSSCMQSVARIKEIKRGRSVWFCMRHHNVYNRIRRVYKRKCPES